MFIYGQQTKQHVLITYQDDITLRPHAVYTMKPITKIYPVRKTELTKQEPLFSQVDSFTQRIIVNKDSVHVFELGRICLELLNQLLDEIQQIVHDGSGL